jgi:DnaJ-class molecular chaperone
MSEYRKLLEAKNVLGLPERASLRAIKSRHRSLLARWHPDTSTENEETCTAMTRREVAAYEVAVEYCERYAFSFSEKEMKRQVPPDDRWMERFFDDPIWGGG